MGAAIFGHFGDRIGRKAMLSMTIVIMGLGTFLIGLLPTYGQIGILAPVVLVFLRLLQGIGLGGEWGGAVLMVVENAPIKSRGLLGSMVQVGYPVGNLAAIGALTALVQLPEGDFLSWGWRIPFLISVFMVGVGLYIRMQLEETPVFREIEAKNATAKLPILEVLTVHRRSFFTAVGLKLSEISYVSIAGIFAISYVTGKLGERYSQRHFAFCRRGARNYPSLWMVVRPDRPQDDVLCQQLLCDVFCLPDVLAAGHQGPLNHHANDRHRDYFRANCGV